MFKINVLHSDLHSDLGWWWRKKKKEGIKLYRRIIDGIMII